MKRFITSKKGIALLATLVVAAAAAVGAYAYLTTGGSGSGTATAGSTTNNLVIGTDTNAGSPVSVGSGLLPGQSVAVSYSIYNPNTYSVKVASVSGTTAQSVGTCENGPFSYTDDGTADGVTIAPGATAGPYTGTLAEANDPTNNQDDCEAPNSTTLTLTSN
jgi:hypothetical protein